MRRINSFILILFFSLILIGCENHIHNYVEKVIEPTCTLKGYTLYTCNCGDSYKDNEVEALGHNYGEWEIVKEATEEEKGLKERKCNRCNETQTEDIAKKEHTHKYSEEIISPTCVEKGYTLYTCNCGESYKENEVEALGHNYGEWEIVKEATEEEIGLKERKCNRCDETEKEEISLKESYSNIDETINELEQFFNVLGIINSNIDLPTENSTLTTTISYVSSDNNIITDEGIFIRPYQKTTVTLVATITDGITTKTNEFQLLVDGYKNNEQKAASYVYTNYSKVSDQFFEVMDIVYCAFVLIDVDGNFTGKDGLGSSINKTNNTYLGYMQNYIIPKAHNQGDYVIVSVGGGGKAYDLAFEEICKSEEKMNTLANNIVSLINKYGFDGVDIDWEVPDNGTSFTKLMQIIYTAVKENNPNHLVTAAIGGGKWQPPKYDLINSKNYIDYINLMTYNMTTSSGQHHSALYKSKTKFDAENNVAYTLTSCSIEESVDFYKEQYAIEASQLIVGGTFYAIKQERTNNTSEWKYSGTISYDKLKSNYLNNSQYDYYYDTNCQAPYLLSKNKLTFISFDDRTSLKAKCEYVINNGCAGIMYWQNGQDTTGDLVQAIKEGLLK